MKKGLFKRNKEIGENLGVSGFVLGILGIVFLGANGVLISLIGIIFCSIQQKKNPTKIGKSGLIISIIGFILNIAFFITYFTYLAPMMQQLG